MKASDGLLGRDRLYFQRSGLERDFPSSVGTVSVVVQFEFLEGQSMIGAPYPPMCDYQTRATLLDGI